MPPDSISSLQYLMVQYLLSNLLLWLLFPIFFIFLPLGFFAFFRKRNFDKQCDFIVFMICMSLPIIIYAASRDIADPRYFLPLFPIFSIISVYTVREITRKFDKTKLIPTLFIIAIIDHCFNNLSRLQQN